MFVLYMLALMMALVDTPGIWRKSCICVYVLLQKPKLQENDTGNVRYSFFRVHYQSSY